MKKIVILTAGLIAVFCTSVFALDAKYTKAYAEELLKTVDKSLYPAVYKSVITMTTVRAGRGPISNTFEVLSKGEDKSLMKITAPVRDKGKKILKNGDNLWMFMPDISRPIRLSSNQSFMGSTFSNEDLASSGWEDNYTAEITEQKGTLILLTLEAKKNDVAYAKIDMWLDDTTKIPTEMTYYGLSGKAIKKMYMSNIRKIAGIIRPLDMKMDDLIEDGSYTQVKLETMEPLDSLPEYTFDPTQMGR
jgi:outer membrane lipoprotein-sorting protein